MLRDLNVSVNGQRDSSSPRVGVLASEIPSGFALESWLLNDIDPGFPNRLYSLSVTPPAQGTLYLDKAGVGFFTGAPVGVYEGKQRIDKYDPGVGLVSSVTGQYRLNINALVPVVRRVVITPTTAAGSQQFTAEVQGDNSPSQNVTWSKDGPGVISSTGYFTAPVPALFDQVTEIRATSEQDPNFSAAVTVTVAGVLPEELPKVTDIIIMPKAITLQGGGSVQYSAQVLGENGPSQEVTWSTTLGTIDAAGVLVAPTIDAQVTQGTVTATSKEDPTVSKSVNFNVLGTGPVFIPSVARIVKIMPGRSSFIVGSHWTLSTAGPVGGKDPNSTIDIPFDWSAWLADIGGAKLKKVEFLLGGGLVTEGTVPDATGGTVVVSGGTPGASATITCRITTATVPPLTDDRTVVLQIRDQ